jgi:hypothetical protein
VRDEKDVVILLIVLVVNEAGIGRDRAIPTTRARFRPWLQGSTTRVLFCPWLRVPQGRCAGLYGYGRRSLVHGGAASVRDTRRVSSSGESPTL